MHKNNFVYEVVDARIPFSSKIKDIDELIKDKPTILIMTKIDLCDISETNKWITYYEEKGYKVIGVDLINNKNISKILSITDELMIDFNNKRKLKGLELRPIRALILGIPNVGKSTLINRLVGKKVTNVGDKPGITKQLEWIRINSNLELLDSPGILWPKLDNKTIAFNLASMNAIKEEILPIDEVSTYILKTMHKYYPMKLKERYDIENINNEDIVPTFDLIGKKRGCIIRGGMIDYKKVESYIIKDLNNGYLGLITFDRFMNKKEE
jgi:ribosome biogenesis GTPase A